MEKKSGIEIAGSGFGHILKDGNSVNFTSTEAAGTFAQTLIKMAEAMAKDLSDLTGVPVAKLIDDYITENELSLMVSAFRAVLRKSGIKPEKTGTREVIEDLKARLKEDREKEAAALVVEVPEHPFGKYKCETDWDKKSHRYVYKITYPEYPDVVFSITSDSEEKLGYDDIQRRIRRREVDEFMARR
jgi:hypothetical protein